VHNLHDHDLLDPPGQNKSGARRTKKE